MVTILKLFKLTVQRRMERWVDWDQRTHLWTRVAGEGLVVSYGSWPPELRRWWTPWPGCNVRWRSTSSSSIWSRTWSMLSSWMWWTTDSTAKTRNDLAVSSNSAPDPLNPLETWIPIFKINLNFTFEFNSCILKLWLTVPFLKNPERRNRGWVAPSWNEMATKQVKKKKTTIFISIN